MKATPAVNRNLNLAASSLVQAGAELARSISFVFDAATVWFAEHAAVFDARAEVDDPEEIEALEDE